MQTRSYGTLIGRNSGQTTFVPLWDRMEGAWPWTPGSIPASPDTVESEGRQMKLNTVPGYIKKRKKNEENEYLKRAARPVAPMGTFLTAVTP
jgi:hypothetical protein